MIDTYILCMCIDVRRHSLTQLPDPPATHYSDLFTHKLWPTVPPTLTNSFLHTPFSYTLPLFTPSVHLMSL